MALLKIELRLKPGVKGQQELDGWPQESFTPDFIVAASGLARIELESKLIGVAADSQQPTATTTDHLHGKQINYWLPDYTAGFALNLGDAAASLKAKERNKVSAKFLDEPLELRLERIAADTKTGTAKSAPDMLKISFLYSGETITEAKAPTVLVLAEIGRTLQDFMVQILDLNPLLADQKDVKHLREVISRIVS